MMLLESSSDHRRIILGVRWGFVRFSFGFRSILVRCSVGCSLNLNLHSMFVGWPQWPPDSRRIFARIQLGLVACSLYGQLDFHWMPDVFFGARQNLSGTRGTELNLGEAGKGSSWAMLCRIQVFMVARGATKTEGEGCQKRAPNGPKQSQPTFPPDIQLSHCRADANTFSAFVP